MLTAKSTNRTVQKGGIMTDPKDLKTLESPGRTTQHILQIPAIPGDLSAGYVGETGQWFFSSTPVIDTEKLSGKITVDDTGLVQISAADLDQPIITIFADHRDHPVGSTLTLRDIIDSPVPGFVGSFSPARGVFSTLIKVAHKAQDVFINQLHRTINTLGEGGCTQFLRTTRCGTSDNGVGFIEFCLISIQNVTWPDDWEILCQRFQVCYPTKLDGEVAAAYDDFLAMPLVG